jgi:1-acyl-sn-glycerol-3-phosphate acyltransferase
MFQNTWYQMGRAIVNFYARGIMHVDIHLDCALPKGAKIIAANHPCTNDPAFVTLITREHVTILIKGSLFKLPLFGHSLQMAGHVPVIQGKGQAAVEAGIRLLKAGRTVMIFPEGEISPEGGFHRAHSGLARLALATGAPVIPVGISLNQKKVHRVVTQVDGDEDVGTWYLKGPYALTVGQPMVFNGCPDDRDQVQQVTGTVMQHIARLSQSGHRRLALRDAAPAPRVPQVVTAPKAAAQFAWKGAQQTWLQGIQAIGRSPVFRTFESLAVLVLMFFRHF